MKRFPNIQPLPDVPKEAAAPIILIRGDADECAAASRIFEAVLDLRAKRNGHFITRPNADRGW